jgi:hypothetical protein
MSAETPGILLDPVSIQGDYVVTFNGSGCGLVDDVDPSGVKMILKPITTGSTGKDNVIGLRLVGVQGTIKIKFRQLTLALQQILAPWNDGAVPLQLIPPLNTDLYDFSCPLILHPDNMGAATTQDLTFAHAVPINLPMTKRDGGTPDAAEIEFAIFPDRAVFNTSFGAMTVGNIKGT